MIDNIKGVKSVNVICYDSYGAQRIIELTDIFYANIGFDKQWPNSKQIEFHIDGVAKKLFVDIAN